MEKSCNTCIYKWCTFDKPKPGRCINCKAQRPEYPGWVVSKDALEVENKKLKKEIGMKKLKLAVSLCIIFLVMICNTQVNSVPNPVEGRNEVVQQSNSVPREEWSDWQKFEATAYTHMDDGCNKITKTEFELSPQARVVAADPSVIPLGSKVEIKGYGIYYAEDIGGAIKKNRIDIFHWNRQDALEFGRRQVLVRWKKDE